MDVELDFVPEKDSYYSKLVENQKIALISSFTLESGRILQKVPVAYKTWGSLNPQKDNVLVLCHALTGSSDAEDWWRPLMGYGKALDYSKFFIFCANVLGSPYGSASPLTTNPETDQPYGPEFPETTVRDDVRIQKLILDALGVRQVAAVVGGSMGGMAVVEWPLCTPTGFVNSIIPITTAAFQSAWGISWTEAQVRCIQADAAYQEGWYDPVPESQPTQGLGAARMIAMLTYRSCASFESRFNRRLVAAKSNSESVKTRHDSVETSRIVPNQNLSSGSVRSKSFPQPTYAAQSYLQYQADKFLKRFDANCYIHLVRKMDTHDVTRGRIPVTSHQNEQLPRTDDLKTVLRGCPTNALVVSVDSDILFTAEQQILLSECLPDAKFVNLDSPDGHDGFLLEFEALGNLVCTHLKDKFPHLYEDCTTPVYLHGPKEVVVSVFGEAEPTF